MTQSQSLVGVGLSDSQIQEEIDKDDSARIRMGSPDMFGESDEEQNNEIEIRQPMRSLDTFRDSDEDQNEIGRQQDQRPVAHDNSEDGINQALPTTPTNSVSEVEIDIMEVDMGRRTKLKAGRKQSVIWDSFDTIKSPDKKSIVSNKCRSCRSEVSAQPHRMNLHILKCLRKQRNIGQLQDVLVSLPVGVPMSSNSGIQASEPNRNTENGFVTFDSLDSFTSSTSKLKQQSIQGYVNKVGKKKASEVDKQLGRFIFSANLPFNVVRCPQFKQFVKMLNPAYNIPTHEVIGSTILDQIYNEIKQENVNSLKAKKAVLLQDGWSTKQNDSVIAHCLSTGDKTYFLNAECVGNRKGTADVCFEMLEVAMVQAEREYGCEVIGAITDNCSTMMAMQDLVTSKYPDLEAYGCNSHLFNLVGKHYTPNELEEKVSLVHNYMRNHHATTAALKEKEAGRPIMPGKTRWNSQIDSFLNYCDNHSKYLDVVRKLTPTTTKDREGLNNVKMILNDSTVYEQLEATIEMLKPICIALDKMQQENATLADAARYWIKLCHLLPDETVKDKYFIKQKDLGMTALSISAYMLHPHYKGRGLSEEDEDKGLRWLENKNPMYLIYLSELKNEDSKYFKKSFKNAEVCKSLDPRQWWKSATNAGVGPQFIDFVNRLFTYPASTGGIERMFSTLGNTMTKQRNRLSVEKAAKLCSIHNHYKHKLHEEMVADDKLRKSRKRKFNEDDSVGVNELY